MLNRISLFLIGLMSVSLLLSTQLPDGFEQQIKDSADRSAALALVIQYAAQTDDLDDLRILQNHWLRLDRESCVKHFQVLADKHPKDPKYYYLHARAQDEPAISKTAGRKLVQEHPDFEQGYQMLLTYYLQNLFVTPDPQHPAAQPLMKDYKADKKYFKQYMDRFADNENALYMEMQRLIWEQDTKNANLLAAKALRLNADWLSWQFYTDFYLRTGQFDLLEAYIRSMIDTAAAYKTATPQEKENYFEEDYFLTLIIGKAYAEAISWFEQHPRLFGNSVLRKEFLKANVLLGNMDKAFILLDNELALGSDWSDWIQDEAALSALRNDPRWQSRIEK
ncbi:MAG: hypothetical protein R6V77_02450 [Candidatus Cloacimonadaceae bacterium]